MGTKNKIDNPPFFPPTPKFEYGKFHCNCASAPKKRKKEKKNYWIFIIS
jgi:hypothetical protein